jgi:hypothetical protein
MGRPLEDFSATDAARIAFEGANVWIAEGTWNAKM